MPTMNNLNISSPSTRLARLAAVALLLGGVTVGALAQYKIVGPDGKVTYTDKPPTPQDIRPSKGSAAPAANGGLPFETRQAMTKYPVTLYSTKYAVGAQTGQTKTPDGDCTKVSTERTRTYVSDGHTAVDHVVAIYQPAEGVHCP